MRQRVAARLSQPARIRTCMDVSSWLLPCQNPVMMRFRETQTTIRHGVTVTAKTSSTHAATRLTAFCVSCLSGPFTWELMLMMRLGPTPPGLLAPALSMGMNAWVTRRTPVRLTCTHLQGNIKQWQKTRLTSTGMGRFAEGCS